MFKRRKKKPNLEPISPMEFIYRGRRVSFDPEKLDIAMDLNLTMWINGEHVSLDREESMQFAREYFRWLDKNRL